jgi:hypothetical protein
MKIISIEKDEEEFLDFIDTKFGQYNYRYVNRQHKVD